MNSPEITEHLLCGDCNRWTVPCQHCGTPGIGRCLIDGRYYCPDSVCKFTEPVDLSTPAR